MIDMYWLIKASVNVSILNDFVMLFETLPISGTGKYLHPGNCPPAKLPTPGNCSPKNYSLRKLPQKIALQKTTHQSIAPSGKFQGEFSPRKSVPMKNFLLKI